MARVSASTRSTISRYGHAAPDQSIEIVNLRLVVTVPRMQDTIGRWLSKPWQPEGRRGRAAPARRVRRSERGRSRRASCGGRILRPAREIAGPALIEEPNSTTLIAPGDRALIDAFGNIIITLPEGESEQ